MNVCRVFPAGPMPSADDVAALGQFATSIISDCQLRFGGPVGIGPVGGLKPSSRIAGPAFTVKTRPGDNLAVHQALTMVEPGMVVVVDAGGAVDRAILGEIMARQAQASGVVAVVVDGAVRDAEEIDELGLPVFAAGVTHSGPYRTGPGELRGDISIGGSVVSHGDVIVGDSDGIVVVRREDAGRIARLSAERDEMEMGMLALASRAETDYSWLESSVVIEHVAEEEDS